MSDNKTTAQASKPSFADKAAKWTAIGAAAVGTAAVIPQDKLPNFWEALKAFLGARWEDIRTGATKFRPIAFAWGAKLWFWAKIWLGLSLALIVAGIEVENRFHSNASHVLVALGTFLLLGLGFAMYVLSEGIATILFFKIKIAGGIFKRGLDFIGVDLPDLTPEEIKERKLKLKKWHDKVKLVLAGTVVLGFSLIFTMFFPAYSTLGWTICFWPPILVALGAAIYREMEMGKAVDVVFYATIAILVGMVVVFILDRLTGGAIGFAPIQQWMRNWNGTEVIWGLQALIVITLLILGGFAKETNRGLAFKHSAIYLLIGFAVLDGLLLYKGTMSWKDGTGHDAPKAVHETIDKIENTSFSDLESKSDKKAEDKPSSYVPQGTNANAGIYLPPPSGDPMPREEAPTTASKPPKATTQRRASKPLPKEEAKTYSNLTQGMDDLEALGY